MGKLPSFDGDSGARGFGRHGRGPGRGSGGCGHGSGHGSGVHGPGTSSAVPITYQLGDTPNTPESIDSVGTSTPNNPPLVERSRSSSAFLSATLAVEAAAAEVRAANARANATTAAEIAAAAAAAAAAATEAQVAAVAAQAAAAGAQALENEAVHDEYPNANKILVGVAPGRITQFQPSTATKMNQIFKNKVQEEGSNWTKVTPEMKDNYWEEFKKHFIWARGAEEAVKQCWKKTAGRRYRDFINDRKKEAVRRDYIPEAVWNKWKAEWNTPEALELSRKKKLARLGRNGQCSKHTGGSITASEHAIRFEMKNKRKPTCNELFEITHRRKDKTFVDEKSATINATFNAKKLALSQQSDESVIVVDDDEIFLEVVGGPNKGGGVYGLGSQSSSVSCKNSTLGSSSSTLPQQVSIAMMQDFVQQALNDFGLQNEENMERRIGKAIESQMSPFESSLLQIQNLLASMTSGLQGQLTTQVTGKAVHSDEQLEDEDENMREDDLND